MTVTLERRPGVGVKILTSNLRSVFATPTPLGQPLTNSGFAVSPVTPSIGTPSTNLNFSANPSANPSPFGNISQPQTTLAAPNSLNFGSATSSQATDRNFRKNIGIIFYYRKLKFRTLMKFPFRRHLHHICTEIPLVHK